MPDPHPHPLGLPALAYADRCVQLGVRGGRVGALDRYARLYREGRPDPLLPPLCAPVTRRHASESGEGTVLKFTQTVRRTLTSSAVSAIDGSGGLLAVLGAAPAVDTVEIESVLIPMIGKKRGRSYTLCVSSQVGCAMGCTFCQTAQMGLIRSLSTEEIVGQWFAARHIIERPDPDAEIRNIVFMGMGEPMDNLDAVMGAIEVFTDRRGPGLAMSKITVSTVGRTDGIARLAQRIPDPGWHRLGLAISLNAPTDEIRSRIMPVNRAMPLAQLRAQLEAWPIFGGAHMCVEYVLIPGVNDQPEHVEQLAAFMQGSAYGGPAQPRYPGPPLQGLVNLIPYNPRDASPWPAPTEESVEAFMAALSATRVYVKRRRTKGRDQMAACGQLGNPQTRRTRSVPV